jgi:plastocyanin
MLKHFLRIAAVAVFVCVIAAAESQAAEWGSLKGRIVIEGTPPAVEPLKGNDKDPYCMGKMPKNKAIVIGKDNALVNAVINLRLATGQKIEANPEYKAELEKPLDLDNNGCEFHPHVTLAQVGQTLDIKNSDPVGHNTNVQALQFNQIIPSNGDTKVKVSTAAAIPSEVSCNIHPFMKGWILIQNHPYMAVTDNDGNFEIKDIPAGKHEFQFWQEAAGYLKNVKIKSGTTERHGRIELTIEPGKTLDLGDIKVPASALNAAK